METLKRNSPDVGLKVREELADNPVYTMRRLMEKWEHRLTPNNRRLSERYVKSSGMSTSRWVRWFDHKYGVERKGHDWVKVHIACGVKTNVITAAAIYERESNDCPILPELVKTTAEHFAMKEVSADKGYLSVDNIETIFAAGAVPFIAFKSNSTGGKGGLFEKMFHYYQFNRDEYMSRYHKRSNVESTFSMVKRKFGDHLRTRTDVAMRNEVYAKLLCHNLCCVRACCKISA